MTARILETVCVLLLSGIVVWAVIRMMRKAKYGGGCCGEYAAAEKSVSVMDKDKSHYPYCVYLKISGMICSNCAKRVENALNTADGVWAIVDKNTDTAHILTKQIPDTKLLCGVVAKAGYAAELK